MDGDSHVKQSRTLLERYDLTVDNLTFEYVKECKDRKKLERMMKVLRSGQEGHYPDLTRSCEDRLRLMFPESRVLVTAQAAMPMTEQRDMDDIKAYSASMGERDRKLVNDLVVLPKVTSFAPIRQTATIDLEPAQKPAPKTGGGGGAGDGDKKTPAPKKSVVPRSYAEWDKFDPEEEMLKMDLHEERKEEKKEKMKKNKMSKNTRRKVGKYPHIPVETKVMPKDVISPAEQEAMSLVEKSKGNESYRAKDYQQAVKHYTDGIALHATLDHYTNRAAAYLKLKQYCACADDCTEALRHDPWNVKALYRRGVALKQQGRVEEAAQDLRQVMEIEPKNALARQLLCEMELDKLIAQKAVWEEKSCLSAPSSRRMMIQELN